MNKQIQQFKTENHQIITECKLIKIKLSKEIEQINKYLERINKSSINKNTKKYIIEELENSLNSRKEMTKEINKHIQTLINQSRKLYKNQSM